MKKFKSWFLITCFSLALIPTILFEANAQDRGVAWVAYTDCVLSFAKNNGDGSCSGRGDTCKIELCWPDEL